MKKPNITPGQWFAETPNYKKHRVDLSTNEHDPINGHVSWEGFARCFNIGDDPKIGKQVMKANATAIAAPPDLLDALIMVLDDPQALDGRPRTAEVVREALLKAGCTE